MRGSSAGYPAHTVVRINGKSASEPVTMKLGRNCVCYRCTNQHTVTSRSGPPSSLCKAWLALTSLYSDISMPKYGLKLRHGNDISMALTSLYSDISMPKYGIRLRHGNDIRMPKYGVKLRHDISMLKYMELSSDMAMTSACSMPKYGVYMGVFASRAPVRGAASYWLLITYPYLLLLLLHLFHHYLQHIYCPQRKYIY